MTNFASLAGQPISGAAVDAAFANLTGNASDTLVTSTGAPTPRVLSDKIAPTVFDYVLPSDSPSDYGPAINRCLSAGYSCDIPTQLPLATPLTFTTPGQKLFGRDRYTSGLSIPASALSTMNTAGSIMAATDLAVGPNVHDLNLTFQQPTSGISWVQYPWALLLTRTPRTRLRNLRFNLGWSGMATVGTPSTGGCGGLLNENLESSCLNENVALDGCFDTVRFLNPHLWPFAILNDAGAQMHPNAANLLAQFTTNAIGYGIGRVDNLDIDNGLTFMKNGMSLQSGADGTGTFGSVVNHDFDNFGGLLLGYADMTFGQCYFTLGTTSSDCVIANGGTVNTLFNACEFYIEAIPASTSGHSACQIGAGSKVSFTGGRARLDVDAVAFLADAAATDMLVDGMKFDRVPTGTYLQPAVLYENGARPMFNSNTHTVMTGGSGASTIFVTVTQDAAGTIVGNRFGGTILQASSSYTALQVGLNAGVSSRPS